ncbi:MAG: hypothetical protein QOG85_514 [Gaiellaceae bacterium]|nr:hypothetical protein [Gaiellaceae bacterium]
MNGATSFRNVIQGEIEREMHDGGAEGSGPLLLNAWQVAEMLHVSVEWVAARRNVLPCFDVPDENGVESLARMRVRTQDLGHWKRATRETR